MFTDDQILKEDTDDHLQWDFKILTNLNRLCSKKIFTTKIKAITFQGNDIRKAEIVTKGEKLSTSRE